MACFSQDLFAPVFQPLQLFSSALHLHLTASFSLLARFHHDFPDDLWVRKPSGNHEKDIYNINVCVYAYITYIHTRTCIYSNICILKKYSIYHGIIVVLIYSG